MLHGDMGFIYNMFYNNIIFVYRYGLCMLHDISNMVFSIVQHGLYLQQYDLFLHHGIQQFDPIFLINCTPEQTFKCAHQSSYLSKSLSII